jgi:hypothetical protein
MGGNAMTTWYGGHGWGWCSVLVNIPVLVALWGAVFTAMVLSVRIALRQPSDPLGPTGTGSPRPEGVAEVRIAPSETGNDEFYRRLM